MIIIYILLGNPYLLFGDKYDDSVFEMISNFFFGYYSGMGLKRLHEVWDGVVLLTFFLVCFGGTISFSFMYLVNFRFVRRKSRVKFALEKLASLFFLSFVYSLLTWIVLFFLGEKSSIRQAGFYDYRMFMTAFVVTLFVLFIFGSVIYTLITRYGTVIGFVSGMAISLALLIMSYIKTTGVIKIIHVLLNPCCVEMVSKNPVLFGLKMLSLILESILISAVFVYVLKNKDIYGEEIKTMN